MLSKGFFTGNLYAPLVVTNPYTKVIVIRILHTFARREVPFGHVYGGSVLMTFMYSPLVRLQSSYSK